MHTHISDGQKPELGIVSHRGESKISLSDCKLSEKHPTHWAVFLLREVSMDQLFQEMQILSSSSLETQVLKTFRDYLYLYLMSLPQLTEGANNDISRPNCRKMDESKPTTLS